MLLLTRKLGQKVLINKGTIEVKIMKINHGIITLGFLAAEHVDIDREEIYWQKQANLPKQASTVFNPLYQER